MQIHLSREGEQQKGPLTLEQINRDLADRKYRDEDYWAWYEGLEAWIPLHAVPGVKSPGSAGTVIMKRAPEEAYHIETEFLSSSATKESPKPPEKETPDKAADPTTEPIVEGAKSKLSSGMPSGALEHVFAFTSGDGPALRESSATATMLLEVVGGDLEAIRDHVTRDVFGKCNIGQRIRAEGKVPGSAWRAMASLRPELVQRAKAGDYRICVRTFITEDESAVAVFLFYSKNKL